MAYILLENGIVKQVDRSGNRPSGFVKAPDDVVCGQVFLDGKFENPVVVRTWDEVKSQRDDLLASSDWTQLPDVVPRGTLTLEQQQAWAEYRSQVYYSVKEAISPEDVTFPQPPE